MKTPVKFLTFVIVFFLGMSGFCIQALAQTQSAMPMESTHFSDASPCNSPECYEPAFECCDDDGDDHDSALLHLRSHPSLKKQVITPPFQSPLYLFQQHEIQSGFHCFLHPASPLSLTGIVVKKE